MNIYETHHLNEKIPHGFQAVVIPLDARMDSSLDWKKEREAAHAYKEKGFKLFFELDFGLFNSLRFPLSNETQMQAMHLSIRHFSETLWKEFQGEIVGVSLFKGELKEALEGGDFLSLLGAQLPDDAVPFVLLKAEGPQQLAAAKEQFAHFKLAINGGGAPIQEFAWGKGVGPKGYIGRVLPEEERPIESVVGVCIPEKGSQDLEDAMKLLRKRYPHFRIIPETQLTSEWEGLDYVIVDSKAMNPLGKRKLMGFCAAGGIVISLDEPAGVANEMTFQDFTKQ